MIQAFGEWLFMMIAGFVLLFCLVEIVKMIWHLIKDLFSILSFLVVEITEMIWYLIKYLFKRSEIVRSEQVLKDYYSGQLAQRIESRKLELAYPPQPENDINIRVSESSVGDPTEREVLNRVMDLRLATLERRLMCVEKFISDLTDEDRRILQYRYKHDYMWIKVARLVHMSRMTCYRHHKEMLIELEKYLAWDM